MIRKYFRVLLTLIFVLPLSSCLVPIPSGGRHFDPQDLTLSSHQARVIIYRRNSPKSSSQLAVTYVAHTDNKVSIDNNSRALLQSPSQGKGYASYMLNPGKHVVRIYDDKKLVLQQNIYVQAGKRYFWELSYVDNGVALTPINQQTAESRMVETRWDVIE